MQHKLSRRRFLKLAAGGVGGAALFGAGTVGYSAEIEPGWLQVVPIALTLPRLPQAFNGFRMVQISDFHADNAWMNRDRLLNIMRVVNDQQPDLIAFTGDFVTQLPLAPLMLDFLAAFKSVTVPTLAILGNHDHWTDAPTIRRMMGEAGLIDLSNTVHTIQRNGAELHFGGVDDIWEKQDRFDLVLKQLPATGAAILLVHEPDFADTSSQTGRFDLQISGHSHGGQVIIPFYGPAVRIRLAQKYPVGLYTVGSMFQYTNRGLGMVGPQVRFNCRPEITVFTLNAPTV